MNPTNYQVIVFDLGNVLVPFDFNIAFDSINKIEAKLGDKFKKLYFANFFLHENFEKNLLTQHEFTEKMLSFLDYKIDSNQFCEIYSSIFTVNEKMVQLLPELKKNYKLVLMSNTNIIHQKYGWEKYKFIDYFDKLILSHEIGASKPEIEIYRAVENFTNVKPEFHFYVDDIEKYVDTAKSIGWDGTVFTTYEKFIKELQSKHIL